MSSPVDEKSTLVNSNVLTINRPSPSRTQSNQSVLSTIQDVDSTHSLSPSQTPHEKSSLAQETSPFSPFYNPNPTRYSLEAQKSSSKQNIAIYDTDVEAYLTPQQTTKSGLLSKAKTGATQECTVWPGQQQMKRKKKAMKHDRISAGICGCMAGFDRKTRIWIKVLIALVVVALAVGVGVGISRAVGGGVGRINVWIGIRVVIKVSIGLQYIFD
ncbi:hypothetical protein DID88_008842 [Monilinia fructigena]|uniref:Uncharacterized protein n=1 Tax=Monilinia fructigena TaxID=38457 RepID=A0A395J6Q3_9HELO|nr:hypothetical protein DID88_008842 [Monilinia fructigena]